MGNDVVLLIKGAITECTEEEQASIYECKSILDQVVTHYGSAAIFALALVGAEQQEKVNT